MHVDSGKIHTGSAIKINHYNQHRLTSRDTSEFRGDGLGSWTSKRQRTMILIKNSTVGSFRKATRGIVVVECDTVLCQNHRTSSEGGRFLAKAAVAAKNISFGASLLQNFSRQPLTGIDCELVDFVRIRQFTFAWPAEYRPDSITNQQIWYYTIQNSWNGATLCSALQPSWLPSQSNQPIELRMAKPDCFENCDGRIRITHQTGTYFGDLYTWFLPYGSSGGAFSVHALCSLLKTFRNNLAM